MANRIQRDLYSSKIRRRGTSSCYKISGFCDRHCAGETNSVSTDLQPLCMKNQHGVPASKEKSLRFQQQPLIQGAKGWSKAESWDNHSPHPSSSRCFVSPILQEPPHPQALTAAKGGSLMRLHWDRANHGLDSKAAGSKSSFPLRWLDFVL